MAIQTIYKFVRKTLRKSFRTNDAIWFCCSLESCPRVEHDTDISVSFPEIEHSVAYIRKMSEAFPWILVQRELEAALQWGHCYPLISYKGEIAGYIKIARGKAYVEDFDDLISLREDEAFVCDTFIDPEHRGRGLSKILLSETIAWLRGLKVNYLFCHIPEWNKASHALYRGFGFKSIQSARHVRILGCRYYSRRPAQVLVAGRRLHEVQ